MGIKRQLCSLYILLPMAVLNEKVTETKKGISFSTMHLKLFSKGSVFSLFYNKCISIITLACMCNYLQNFMLQIEIVIILIRVRVRLNSE